MEEILERIASEIYEKSYVVVDDLVDEIFRKALLDEQTDLLESGKFRKAAIGTGENKQVRPEIRSDEVLWLEQDNLSPLQSAYFDLVDQIRLTLNRRCFLGLKSFEAHFARYPIGSFYKRHLDQFQQVPYRIVTVIIYLNDSWTEEDEGALRMYIPNEDGTESIQDFLPLPGRMVVFLSAEVPHEVLPTRKERNSITGWLRNID
ncbi:2OG-Fe(II) oxygenase [Algoriphagus sp. CAU 1675]|uniref:2OG-Fe(II) oxygenase n=1 Tax=Algoriphagus sp. CAU 1675 TaxID=3032597 RepID=UPI0023DBD8C5|nr:2OG-Fe(II) oxygenase [Algoriphagus sp. CAU 1675]MDF2158300.1 2OG-Fe(II) oxygenase [Algoriphagus sp. CAU 1675]